MIANIAKSDQSSVPQANSFTSKVKDDQIEEIFPAEDKRIAKLQEEEKDIRSEQIPVRAKLKLDFNLNSSVQDTE